MNGEKIPGTVQVPTKLLSKKAETIQQNHITFFNKKGQKLELNAGTAKEVGFTYEGEDIVFRALPQVIQKVTHVKADFYKLIVDGNCTMYLAYTAYGDGFQTGYCLFKDENHYYYTTSGVTHHLVKAPGRIENLKELFEDCPEPVAKIKNKEFNKGDNKYFNIVQYYNHSCQATETEQEEAEDQ
jgi:hypothetical protein